MLEGTKVAILVAEGFEQSELTGPKKRSNCSGPLKSRALCKNCSSAVRLSE